MIAGCWLVLLAGTSFCGDDTLDLSAVVKDRGRGGIVVHLGASNPDRLLKLHEKGGFVIQALDRDIARVAAARKTIQAGGVYGPVSVRQFREDRLPFRENLVNLVIVDDRLDLPDSEILRVLAPLGAAWFREGTTWKKRVKPWPDEIDEWTHFLHGADGNAVSSDSKVGPPRRLQWSAGSFWGRSHEMNNSFPALVTARGRMYFIFDQGITGIEDPRLPEKWTLMARDSFNGTLLWEHPLKNWGSHLWRSRALRFFGGNMARRLTVDGDRLYCTLDYGGPVMMLDGATGEDARHHPRNRGRRGDPGRRRPGPHREPRRGAAQEILRPHHRL